MAFRGRRVLAVTLARGGSKGVARKNVRNVASYPLIAYTIAAARKSRHIDRYLVSTDDEEIQQTALDWGAEAPFLRPAELAMDTTTAVPALQHAVAWAEADDLSSYDIVVELLCSNPFKTAEHIDAAIEKLVATGADSVIGVARLENLHPARVKRIENDRIVDFAVPETSPRRQDLRPHAFVRNDSIYAMNRDKLMHEGLRAGSDHSRPLIMESHTVTFITSELDLTIAEAILTKHPSDSTKALAQSLGR